MLRSGCQLVETLQKQGQVRGKVSLCHLAQDGSNFLIQPSHGRANLVTVDVPLGNVPGCVALVAVRDCFVLDLLPLLRRVRHIY